MKNVILICAWLLGAIANAGFVNANFRAEFPSLCDSRWARSNLSFAVGWSLLPVTWVITPFVTGFYQDGWTLSGTACHARQDR